MAKKKKGKSKEKDEGGDAAPSSTIMAPPPNMLLPEKENYVTLELNLMNWRFMNFKLRLKTATHLFTVKDALLDRHGRIKDLVVCHGSFAEKNEMHDDMQTLADYGLDGAPEGEEASVVQIFYEFKPCDHDDPLLLHMGSDRLYEA
ncbi:hypothetical protein M885DRAFT_514970 [Pelagophyceae sp. CCMP2097]|nr:hypothetical protein M885DRAFT_514970 [Pelagophyceae sp. CCMP2097]|mmetsp:Transcript_464/g.1587  ORF Transcript_464/g.1587 Transcript_464/m.1587 type:complete len:146 (+) Transcript_464:67-504(+)|eukprot:CAMPEP_0184116304 /NCGR_PEP_ID=MMETSP0974-20121125/20362_1 /TAXON_ID=483370 /ORGANISM="non described non described, Strain CCMP2097" /LENGTH=145 /DNA_ID=CAMNT_0026419425 /DNA_START=16 /DNA_END=453 /DNA_ORIENTATION=+